MFDKQLKKGLAKKMINPYYFTNRALRVGFNKALYRHHINHANSELNIKQNFPEFGIETRYDKKITRKWLVFMLD